LGGTLTPGHALKGPTSGSEGGISGWDFNVPESFTRYFPQATDEWIRDTLKTLESTHL
jgi:hypothetical protein